MSFVAIGNTILFFFKFPNIKAFLEQFPIQDYFPDASFRFQVRLCSILQVRLSQLDLVPSSFFVTDFYRFHKIDFQSIFQFKNFTDLKKNRLKSTPLVKKDCLFKLNVNAIPIHLLFPLTIIRPMLRKICAIKMSLVHRHFSYSTTYTGIDFAPAIIPEPMDMKSILSGYSFVTRNNSTKFLYLLELQKKNNQLAVKHRTDEQAPSYTISPCKASTRNVRVMRSHKISYQLYLP